MLNLLIAISVVILVITLLSLRLKELHEEFAKMNNGINSINTRNKRQMELYEITLEHFAKKINDNDLRQQNLKRYSRGSFVTKSKVDLVKPKIRKPVLIPITLETLNRQNTLINRFGFWLATRNKELYCAI